MRASISSMEDGPSGRSVPIGANAIMVMRFRLPIAIAPSVVAEIWRVLQLLFGDAGAIAVDRCIVFERLPGNGIMAVTETQKAAKTHHGIGNAPGDFLDHEVVDRAELGIVREGVNGG